MGKAAIKTAPERDEVAPVWRIYAGKQQSAPREHESSRLGQLRSSNEPACSRPDASCLFESSPRIHFSLMRSSRLSAIFQTAAGMRPAVFFPLRTSGVFSPCNLTGGRYRTRTSDTGTQTDGQCRQHYHSADFRRSWHRFRLSSVHPRSTGTANGSYQGTLVTVTAGGSTQ